MNTKGKNQSGRSKPDFRGYPFDIKSGVNALALGIILCHNHPSGSLRPSTHDDALTERIQKAAKLMDIRILDHIILSDSGYYSYADEGRLVR